MKKYFKYICIAFFVFLLSFLYAHINKMHAVFNEDVDQGSFTSTDISSQEEFQQRFTCEEKAIDGVALKFARTGEEIEKVELVYSLEDIEGNTLGEGVLKGEDFKNQKYNKLKVDRIEDAKGKEFIFKCHLENNDDTNGISMYYEGNTLVMKYYLFRFDFETFFIACSLCVYVIVFMKILFKMFKE